MESFFFNLKDHQILRNELKFRVTYFRDLWSNREN